MIPSSLLLAGLNVSYGIGEYSVRLQWQLSSDEDVDNYTILGKHVYCSDRNTLANNSPSIEIQSAILP